MNSKERSLSFETNKITWNEVELLFILMAEYIRSHKSDTFSYIYGIPRGGLIPAVWLSHHLDLELIFPDEPMGTEDYDYHKNVLFVDDVVDMGNAIKGLSNVISIVKKPWSPLILYAPYTSDKWIKFPWENE